MNSRNNEELNSLSSKLQKEVSDKNEKLGSQRGGNFVIIALATRSVLSFGAVLRAPFLPIDAEFFKGA